RAPVRGLSGQRAAARSHSTHRGRAGLNVWLGTLCRQEDWPHHWHEDIRRVGSSEGVVAQIPVRTRACDGGREKSARQSQERKRSGVRQRRSERQKRLQCPKRLLSYSCSTSTTLFSTTIWCRAISRSTWRTPMEPPLVTGTGTSLKNCGANWAMSITSA